jgi:hypothetical protein
MWFGMGLCQCPRRNSNPSFYLISHIKTSDVNPDFENYYSKPFLLLRASNCNILHHFREFRYTQEKFYHRFTKSELHPNPSPKHRPPPLRNRQCPEPLPISHNNRCIFRHPHKSQSCRSSSPRLGK